MFQDLERKKIKVVDFGIAGSDSNINVEHTNAGSLRYLAPEVIISRHPAHEGIDVWAMGIILFWMLNGRPPFDGSTR
jgi:serine/threonine protein kinase